MSSSLLRLEDAMENGPNPAVGTMKELELALALFSGGGDTGKVSTEDPAKEKKDGDTESQT